MAEQSFAVPSFEIDDDEETTTTISTVPAASTTPNVGLVSTDSVPSFEVDDTDDAKQAMGLHLHKLDVTWKNFKLHQAQTH